MSGPKIPEYPDTLALASQSRINGPVTASRFRY